MRVKKAISLFASGGIGDLALREADVEVIVANELLENRASLFRRNFPNTNMITGDIWKMKDQLVAKTIAVLGGDELDFMLATPPCQGMSKNGQGKLLNEIRAGKRPQIDPRNRLIIPTMEIAKKLKPRVLVFENVPEMASTIIDDEDGNYISIIDFIKRELGEEYEGRAEVVAFADYGIPQRRSRLITIFTRDENLKKSLHKNGSLLPPRTHSRLGLENKQWVSVRDIIGTLPKLDSINTKAATSNIPYHNVPVLDSKKYTWISNTPAEKGAFDNQCINPSCLYQSNPVHGSTVNEAGVNRASNNTPIHCQKCGELLPRPYTVNKDGSIRLMKGYTSAYKRMRWDLPASTLTTNLQYPSSDHKLHPEQNRVLSLHEAFLLHTLDKYDYSWELENSKPASKALIRDVIGESIPPKGLEIIFRHILAVEPSSNLKIVETPDTTRQVSKNLRFAGLES